MTFSLKSNFSLTEKRSLLITAGKAVAYQCQNGRASSSYEFSADESGRDQFTRYLTETNADPVYVLVDIVEEEYRQDVIPHLFGADRKSVLGRKFSRLFRGTSYCHALTQGREKEGRKDDKVLLTAITKPDVISPWIDLMLEQNIPNSGIFSLPILSERLLKIIGATGANILLLRVQNASGLRQTFFRDRHIKISRLAPMPRIGSVPYGSYLMGELEKLRRYLNSLALISFDGPLKVYILSHGEWLNELEHHCRDTEEEKYFLLDVADVAANLGLGKKLTTAYSDAVFNQLLLDEAPKNHYASVQETKYFTTHRMRNGLLAASVLLLLGSMGWSGLNFLDGVSLKREALDAQQKADFYHDRYSMARRDLPPTPIEPRDIKTAVDIVQTLRHYKSGPSPMLEVISGALETAPKIRLDAIEWYFAVDPNSTGNDDPRRTRDADGVQIERDAKYSHYHIAEFNAHLPAFSGDFRGAITQTDEFAAELARNPDVRHVEVTKYPLDVTPDGSLSGTATEASEIPEANFTIKVVLGVLKPQDNSVASDVGLSDVLADRMVASNGTEFSSTRSQQAVRPHPSSSTTRSINKMLGKQ